MCDVQLLFCFALLCAQVLECNVYIFNHYLISQLVVPLRASQSLNRHWIFLYYGAIHDAKISRKEVCWLGQIFHNKGLWGKEKLTKHGNYKSSVKQNSLH